MNKLSSVAIHILGVTIGVVAVGALRTATRPSAVKPDTSSVQPAAIVSPASSSSQTWDEYMAQEACANLRKGMELQEAGMQAGVSANDNGYASQYKDMTMADMQAKLTKTLVETCPSDIASAAEREGLN